MIIRGTPINEDDYILVDSSTSVDLQELGFIPKYIDNRGIYYLKTDLLIETIERRYIGE